MPRQYATIEFAPLPRPTHGLAIRIRFPDLPHEAVAGPDKSEVPRLLDRGRRDIGVRRERHEQRRRAGLVHTRDDGVGALRCHSTTLRGGTRGQDDRVRDAGVRDAGVQETDCEAGRLSSVTLVSAVFPLRVA